MLTSAQTQNRWGLRSGGSKKTSKKNAANPSGAFPDKSVEKNCLMSSQAMTSMALLVGVDGAKPGETRLPIDSLLTAENMPRLVKMSNLYGIPSPSYRTLWKSASSELGFASLRVPKVARAPALVRCGMVLENPVAVVAVVDTAHPGDTGPLERWMDANPLADILCVLGKTEGNGCVNDFTRGYATSAIQAALGRVRSRRMGATANDDERNRQSRFTADPAIIMSGGTEGE